tara:strand:- start:60 stop:281 length:222 start_codon:yes stop_codon:yes gene_type:complete
MAKGKKSALALAKEKKEFEDIKKLVASYANTGNKTITPTYDELPKNSSWLNKLGNTFKGTNKNKIQINYEVDF